MQKRLNKFLAETGRCSRREADELISQNRVTVNGKPAEMGMQVSFEDEIRVDGRLVAEKTGKAVYLAFNKPPGIECTTNQDVRDNIIDFLNYPTRIFPIGRLDKASEGLIFLTDDGDIVNKILRARNNHEKEYIVTVDKPVSNRFITRMSNGIPILDTVTRKCEVEQIDEFTFRIVLTQGLNRQIRRMCEYLDYQVVKLRRVRIINIKLDLPLGRYRELTESEITELQQLIEPSSKTEEASLPKAEPRPKNFKRSDLERKAAPRERSEKRDFSRPTDKKRPETKNTERTVNQPKRDFKKPERRSPDDSEVRPDNFKPAPKRFEIIKKDDPRYRKKDDLGL